MKRFFIFMTLIMGIGLAQAGPIDDAWTLIRHESSNIDLWSGLTVQLKTSGNTVTVIHKFGARRSFTDSVVVRTDGKKVNVPVTDRVFPTNVFMGLKMPEGQKRTFTAKWLAAGRQLQVTEKFDVLGSQGATPMTVIHDYLLADNDETLTYTLKRSTRPGAPIQYRLKRKGSAEAWYMDIADDWRIDGNLDQQAFLIALQGLANSDGPKLYFQYPETWDFNYTQAVFDFYKEKRYYSFRKLNSWQQALKTFRKKVKGYVVWDKNERTSLIVAFTVAGIEEAVVVSEDMIPAVEKMGLKPVADFRGQFTGQSDVEIYQWAYDQYWDRCSKDYLIWMGGEHGAIMKPGIADWGVYQKAFFQDLSTKPVDKEEYALANTLLKELNPMSMVMGWHSYKKDKERDHVTLTSHYGHRIRGLHTQPNTSFSAQVKPTPGFEYKNNHNVKPGEKYIPEKKVYIACVQTDGVGLGAWTKPGRGELPYAWVLGVNDLWMAPAMLEFFYTEATPNDYFIAGNLPGYMYAKAIPAELRPGLLQMTQLVLDTLDVVYTQMMDYSEGATVEGNTELTKAVVDGMFEYMPRVQGFLNGYAPSFTFSARDDRALLSYDYYLAPQRPISEAVQDLVELGQINAERPYFLLAHIRQWSDIRRVKEILDQLPEEFEVVPLDIFMKMAAEAPTFKENYLER